jgi:hypothetical protein
MNLNVVTGTGAFCEELYLCTKHEIILRLCFEYELRFGDFNIVSIKVISFNSVLSFKYKFWVLLERAPRSPTPRTLSPNL